MHYSELHICSLKESTSLDSAWLKNSLKRMIISWAQLATTWTLKQETSNGIQELHGIMATADAELLNTVIVTDQSRTTIFKGLGIAMNVSKLVAKQTGR